MFVSLFPDGSMRFGVGCPTELTGFSRVVSALLSPAFALRLPGEHAPALSESLSVFDFDDDMCDMIDYVPGGLGAFPAP